MPRQRRQNPLFKRLLRSARQPQQGFTLIELLVAIIVGSLIISSLLFLVMELLRVSQREEVLTQAQQDMRRALDYIASDVGESDYVYAAPADLTRLATELGSDPNFPDDPGSIPVLAFWRLDPIDMSELPANPATYSQADPDGCIAAFASDEERSECSALKIRQSAYTLVMYVQVPNGGGSIWEGPSRIVRYSLPKYSDVATLTETVGYDDPSIDDPNDPNDQPFATWVRDGTETPAGTANTLVDHVTASNAETGGCPTGQGYTRVPAASDSFFICARGADGVNQLTGNRVGQNQSLIVNLTGDVNQNPTTGAISDASKLPTIQTEVLVRGVIDKDG